MNHPAANTAHYPWTEVQGPDVPVQLTTKEREILEWAVKGKSTWEIARILDRTEAAVNYHLCNIRRKFGVSSLRAALVKAIDQRVIELH